MKNNKFAIDKENIQEHLDILKNHAKPVLSPKAYNQLIKGVKQGYSVFVEDYIRPCLTGSEEWRDLLSYHRSVDLSRIDKKSSPAQQNGEREEIEKWYTLNSVYIGVEENFFALGKNSGFAHLIADREVEPESLYLMTYFTNFLRESFTRWVKNDEKRRMEIQYESPSERVHGGDWWCFTFEYDADKGWDKEQKIDLLEKQLANFRGKNSQGKKLYDTLTQFSDFRGISACYSGNKSVHCHIVFDTENIWSGDLPRDEVRDGYIRLWHKLADIVHPILDPGKKVDKALRYPELYRKFPCGMVKAKKGNILGFPEGEHIPLPVVFEKFRSRAGGASGGNSNTRFVNPMFLKQHRAKQQVGKYSQKTKLGNLTKEEHEYVLSKLHEIVARNADEDGFPKIDRLTRESNWVCYCYANKDDTNPNLMWYENSARLVFLGGKEPNKDLTFRWSLKSYIKRFRMEYRQKNGLVPKPPVPQKEETSTKYGQEPVMDMNEELLHEFGYDGMFDPMEPDEARTELYSMFHEALVENSESCSVWQTPEGAGKSTMLMDLIPTLINKIEREGKRNIVIAVNDYAMAKEKCLQFNKMFFNTEHNMEGIIIQSFTREYKEVCQYMKRGVITRADAGSRGFSSLIQCINETQPEVWEELKIRHRKKYRSRTRKVFFTAHEALQKWNQKGITGIYWHPEFFNNQPWEYENLRHEMKLDIAVHDEVNIEDLTFYDRAGDVEWFKELADTHKVWKNPEAKLPELYGAFEDYQLSYRNEGINFDKCLELRDIGYAEKDKISVIGKESYENNALLHSNKFRPIYSKRHGTKWYAKKREWWNGLARSTVILTTEELPVAMLGAWNEGLSEEREEKKIAIHRYMPFMKRDSIDVMIMRGCKSNNTEGTVDNIRDKVGEIKIVSNKGKGIENVYTHLGAKGSNQHSNEDLAQTCYFKSPEEYEVLQLLNCVYDLDCSIALSHIDCINQTAGRNLGFRQREGEEKTKHYLVMGHALWGWIQEPLLTMCRYDLVEYRDTKDRDNDNMNSVVEFNHMEAIIDPDDMADNDTLDLQTEYEMGML